MTAAARRLFTLFLIPGNLIMVAVFVLPIATVVAYSFGTTDIVGRPQLGFTWQNYADVFQSFYVPTLLRTILFAAIATLICLLLGYPFAYFVTQFAGRLGAVLVGAILLTWLVDYLVRLYAWNTILASDGVVNDVLGAVGLGPIHLLGTNAAVIIGLVYSYFPLMLLPLVASLSDLDRSVIEAGKDLYGSPLQTFLHVTLPETMPGVVGGVLLVLLPCLGDFAAAQFLGGPGSTMIGSLLAQQLTGTGSLTFGAALTVALLLLLAASLVLAVLVARRGAAGALRGAVQ